MVKKRKISIYSIIVLGVFSMSIFFNDFFSFRTVHAADVKKALTNVTSKITQNGKEIPNKGTLTSSDPISMEVSFGVPVEGDEPTPDNPIKKGDTAIFKMSDAFKLASRKSIPLNMGKISVGTVTFSTDSSTNMVLAKVTFDGDDKVFDGTYNSVSCKFSADFQYDITGDAGAEGNHYVKILDKEYTVNVPPAKIEYSLKKSGKIDLKTKSVEWTANINAIQKEKPIDLAGYKFFDDLTEVGEYVSDSFKVDGYSENPNIANNTINYVFKDGSISPKKVTFKTKIPEGSYYSSGNNEISNIAELKNSEENEIAKDEAKVNFTPPKWIEKKGASSDSLSSGQYNSKGRTITWRITANEIGATLNNVVITDNLARKDDNLEDLQFESANVYYWNGSSWQYWKDISPNENNEYNIGSINSKILLTIMTKVPDADYTTQEMIYKNSASIRWDNMPGSPITSGETEVKVGYNAITKSNEVDEKNRTIHWNVNVDAKSQGFSNLKAYDLFVYESKDGGFDINKAEGFPKDMNKNQLTPCYDNKFINGTFEGSGLNHNVYPILQDGKRVGDLIEVTGLLKDRENNFKFDSLVVSPDIFAGNKRHDILNGAYLFSGKDSVGVGYSWAIYNNKMLSKEMLKRDYAKDLSSTINDGITKNVQEGFNYKDKSVIFRFSVNADGINLNKMTNEKGEFLGKSILVDTLPEGWEYDEISPGLKYMIFEGETGSDSSLVKAKGDAKDSIEGLSASFNKEKATFTFDNLDKPYVILVKARPNNETASRYFSSNGEKKVTNKLKLTSENWATGITASQEVSIQSDLLSKGLKILQAGELQWSVNYKSYEVSNKNSKIEDVLPNGIDLRTDSNGKLILSDDNITVHEMSLNAKGTYTKGSKIDLKLGENISYDNNTRTLKFIIPDSLKSYCLTYVTDVTGNPGKISNKATLYGSDSEQEESFKPYVITAADGEATLKKNGWIIITKTDGENSPLSGAEFTLFASENKTIIRKGVTDSNGNIKFKVIPDGKYIFRETKAPEGYDLEGKDHNLKVTTTGSKVEASIDGKTGEDYNVITIKDYKKGTVGSLEISKEVSGNDADSKKKFDFIVTFEGADGIYEYIGKNVSDGKIKSGDKISLAHGESITIKGLPKDASYKVDEGDYTSSGYSKTSTGEMGVIEAGITKIAAFTNTKNSSSSDNDEGNNSHSGHKKRTGNLTISKKVAGNAADKKMKFDFTVILKGANGNYEYAGKGVPNGYIKSGDKISLAHGESITIKSLPKGASYKVNEADYTNLGYSKSSIGESGRIESSSTKIAAFTNTKNILVPKPEKPNVEKHFGNLIISKKVVGDNADKEKKFDFIIAFEGLTETYEYIGKGVPNGNIKSGDKISLAHGESITIKDLPEGIKYEVKEVDYTKEGYNTFSTGESGTIARDSLNAAEFKNTFRQVVTESVTNDFNSNKDKDVVQQSIGNGKNVIPKTGDNQFASAAKIGLFFFSIAFAVVLAVIYEFNKKRFLKR